MPSKNKPLTEAELAAYESKRDLAAEIAAVLAFSAITNHDRVGLILFSDRVEKHIPPAKGPTHVLRVISEILERRGRTRRRRRVLLS